MTLEQIVPVKDLCEQLRRLGFPQNTHFMWVGNSIWGPSEQSDYQTFRTPDEQTWIAAPTASELGEWLPKGFVTVKCGEKTEVEYQVYPSLTNHFTRGKYDNVHSIFSNTEANARANMLIWLATQGYIEFGKV